MAPWITAGGLERDHWGRLLTLSRTVQGPRAQLVLNWSQRRSDLRRAFALFAEPPLTAPREGRHEAIAALIASTALANTVSLICA